MHELKPDFEKLRDALAVAVDKPDLIRALQQFARDLGFEWFAYLSVDAADVRGLSNYPTEWQAHYLANDLAGVDPVVESISAKREAYAWSDKSVPIALRREHRRFFHEARAFGIRSGVSIPVFHGFGRRALLTFASRQAQAEVLLLADPYAALTFGAFIDGTLQSRDCGNLMAAAPSPLTPNQLESLCWLRNGKTASDIATIRGISRRAVEFQLQSIRNKLNVLTTYQALYIATKRRWI